MMRGRRIYGSSGILAYKAALGEQQARPCGNYVALEEEPSQDLKEGVLLQSASAGDPRVVPFAGQVQRYSHRGTMITSLADGAVRYAGLGQVPTASCCIATMHRGKDGRFPVGRARYCVRCIISGQVSCSLSANAQIAGCSAVQIAGCSAVQ